MSDFQETSQIEVLRKPQKPTKMCLAARRRTCSCFLVHHKNGKKLETKLRPSTQFTQPHTLFFTAYIFFSQNIDTEI